MKSTFIEYLINEHALNEARKNPEQNPKISINKIIQNSFNSAPTLPSINEKNCFVSFTEIDKLGINPKSIYDTPLGIYSYPASHIVSTVGDNNPMYMLPFAGDAKYVNIFSVSGNIINLTKLSNSDLIKYYKKIADFYVTHSNKPWKESVDIVEKFINTSNVYAKFPDYAGGRLWYVTMMVAKVLSERNSPIIWNKLLRSIGIDGAYDPGVGIIHTNEPHQCVVFSKQSIKNNKRYYNKYSPGDTQPKVAHGKFVAQMLKDAKTMPPEEFLRHYNGNNINKFKDKNLIIKFIKHDPSLLNELFIENITTEIVLAAITHDGYIWRSLPEKYKTFKMFKIAINDPKLGEEDIKNIIKYDHFGNNDEQMSKIIDYINQKFPQYAIKYKYKYK